MEQVNAILRQTALHEGAHAVAHERFGHALHYGTILPEGESAGQVAYLIQASNHPDDLARAALAGPIADLICALINGCPIPELRLPDDDGDVLGAMRHTGYVGAHMADLIAETTTFVSQARVWGGRGDRGECIAEARSNRRRRPSQAH